MYLHQFTGTLCRTQRQWRERQQVRGKFLQGVFFILVDVAARVLGKAEHENPSAFHVGRHQRVKSTTCTLSWTGNRTFQYPATQIHFIQSRLRFAHRFTEGTCAQVLFPGPTVKPTGVLDLPCLLSQPIL